jgi:folylpolyglutamate synthase/dihydropteroate synthase
LVANRALPAAELGLIVELFNVNAIKQARNVAAALSQVLLTSNTGDRIVVTGSFFTVAAALQWFEEKGVLSE